MSYGCRQLTPTVPIALDTVDRTLASLLIQQAGKDPGRSYLYGHFGRMEADFTWEHTDRADALRDAAGL